MVPRPFVFGKVPSRGDFVRAGPLGPLVDDLDGWLQRAVLSMRGAPAAETPAVTFVFGRPQGTIAGALIASQDRAGRSFPLVAGGSLEGTPPPTGLTVAQLGPFITAATAAARAVVAGTPPDEALPLLAAPPGLLVPTPLAGGALDEALAPFRQTQAPRYGVAFLLPADPMARAAAAGALLDRLVSMGPPRSAVSVLWTDAPDSRAVVFAGAPTADALQYLLTAQAVDGVYQVDAPEPADRPV